MRLEDLARTKGAGVTIPAVISSAGERSQLRVTLGNFSTTCQTRFDSQSPNRPRDQPDFQSLVKPLRRAITLYEIVVDLGSQVSF